MSGYNIPRQILISQLYSNQQVHSTSAARMAIRLRSVITRCVTNGLLKSTDQILVSYLKLRLIRHAESIGNTQGRMEGQQSTALSEHGRAQVRQLCDRLIHTDPQRPTHLYSSPLLRAKQTALTIHQVLAQAKRSCPVYYSAALQELHPGIFQGLTWAEATQQYPTVCEQLMRSLQWQPVPEAESPSEARNRAQVWLSDLLNTHRPGDTVWAVSHAGLMIQLISSILGSDRTWKLTIDHTAIFEFWLAQTDWHILTQDRFNPEYWILKHFNDTGHLEHPSNKTPADTHTEIE